MQKKLTKMEAIEALGQGFFVRCCTWKPGSYLFYDRIREMIMDQDNHPYYFNKIGPGVHWELYIQPKEIDLVAEASKLSDAKFIQLISAVFAARRNKDETD